MVVLEYPNATYRVSRPSSIDSWKEDFQRFLAYMSVVAILVMLSGRFEQIFVYSTPGGSK